MEKKVHNDDPWFEVTEDLWRDPYVKPKKLRLVADEHVPQQFVDELKKARIDVVTVSQLGLKRKDDEELFTESVRIGRVLLTMDQEFWNLRKFPLNRGGGVIVVEAGSSSTEGLRAFGLLFGCFARGFPGDWTQGLRARAMRDRFILRLKGSEVSYEMKLKGGCLYAREVT